MQQKQHALIRLVEVHLETSRKTKTVQGTRMHCGPCKQDMTERNFITSIQVLESREANTTTSLDALLNGFGTHVGSP